LLAAAEESCHDEGCGLEFLVNLGMQAGYLDMYCDAGLRTNIRKERKKQRAGYGRIWQIIGIDDQHLY
jgi:hypothetical protein